MVTNTRAADKQIAEIAQIAIITRPGTLPQSQTLALDPDVEIPSLEQVRSVLYRPGCGGNRFVGDLSANELTILRWGASAFPAYEEILGDPAADVADIIGVCHALHDLKMDRRQFIHLLVRRLVSPDALVHPGVTPAYGSAIEEGCLAEANRKEIRQEAICLLGSIGSEKEAVLIRPWLYDDDVMVQLAALSSLAKIGGQDDLDAINFWLNFPRTNHVPGLVQKGRTCRDELESRLKQLAADGSRLTR